jgi:hypothetical protein
MPEVQLSADLGAGRGESRSAATVVASASTGADAYAGDASVACGSTERRPASQEGDVAAGGSQGTGVDHTGAMGQPTGAGPALRTPSPLLRPVRKNPPLPNNVLAGR